MFLTERQFWELTEKRLCETDVIDKIRSSIVPTKRLLDGRKPIKFNDKNVYRDIKCYAYALGIMFAEDIEMDECYTTMSYFPGFTNEPSFCLRENPFEKNWITDMLEVVRKDLENLQLSYREVPLNGDISLMQGEYLIKSFLKGYSKEGYPDFHFVRFSPEHKVWFHRMGHTQPHIIEDSNKHIPEISIEYEENSIYGNEPKRIYANQGIYEPFGYFAINEPW